MAPKKIDTDPITEVKRCWEKLLFKWGQLDSNANQALIFFMPSKIKEENSCHISRARKKSTNKFVSGQMHLWKKNCVIK